MAIIDVTDPDNPYQLVLIYASAGCPFKQLVEDLTKVLHEDMPIIITGDFNFDRRTTNALTDFLKTKELIQLVNWPTHKEGGSLDHVYAFKNSALVTRHVPYYSDHEGLCIKLCK